ncbi:disulfide bond corrector protein DsbC [Leptospira inadai serovar Lyme str. 10]|uniref:Disulfide bond corrector protein DsbC n=2 Tax=Leptospira inadai serovar Lyme TaxID=293084 RepID=V6HH13_9LEPT|nr:thioredoxin family protein [Leptospira inadai]EQA35250.1 disulfide bond corrector protein DsbC [Leptospira inadai serovar Lyme str. 10]PNV74197.1 disulfide bond formation protein DsbC [Leptospira inadai serovar Lyme]
MSGYRIGLTVSVFTYIVCIFFSAEVLAESSEYRGAHSYLEVRAVSKSDDFLRLALYIKAEPGWHVYWKNPGDSGTSLRTDWKSSPPGVAADWEWPLPERIELGDSVNFGYEKPTVLFSDYKIQKPLGSDESFHIEAKLHWLVCKEECVPESTTLIIHKIEKFPPGSEKYSAYERSLKELPQTPETGLTISFRKKKDSFLFRIKGNDLPEKFDFFPEDPEIVSNQKIRTLEYSKNLIEFEIPRSEYISGDPDSIRGVLTLGSKIYSIRVNESKVGYLLEAIFFAFLGGILLNLMPCVFPVLFLKAFSISQASNKRTQRIESIFYFGGVLSFFWILFFGFEILRSGGESLGWGYQLQNPFFVFFLILVFVFLGLQMLGAFDFAVGLSGPLVRLADQKGKVGAFFSGALTVLVATPCTAPLMGSALVYAFSENILNGLFVFTSMAVGMSLPLLVFQNSSRLTKLLPKPGAWMRTFKEFLAFPLLMTAIWLFWVFNGITNRNDASLALLIILLLFFFVWINKIAASKIIKKAVLGLTILTVLSSVYVFRNRAITIPTLESGHREISREEYSKERLAFHLKEGHSVFLYFTADWCITCKFNERTVLSTDTVLNEFLTKEIVVLKGDWTSEDPKISAALESYGRNSVPFYVYYPKGKKENPRFLPTMLTTGLLLEALR